MKTVTMGAIILFRPEVGVIRVRSLSGEGEPVQGAQSEQNTQTGQGRQVRQSKQGRCLSCPRYCGVNRQAGEKGFCGAGSVPEVAMADLHMWEEPPISGRAGSGAVFFVHCNLRCVFCQNHAISQGTTGPQMPVGELADAFLGLQKRGAHNINLVSPTHYSFEVAKAIREAHERGLRVPVVYNSNGYDSSETLSAMEGLVDVYLPDIKYSDDALAVRYSAAPNYFHHASRAILEMSRQVGAPVFNEEGLVTRGLIVRHLVLPGHASDSIRLLKWVKDSLPKGTYLSLMAQYYPTHRAREFPEVNRNLRQAEYDRVLDALYALGLEDGFVQELSSADSHYTPKF